MHFFVFLTWPAQPFRFWYFVYVVTHLVNGYVTTVAKDNNVGWMRVTITTDSTECLIIFITLSKDIVHIVRPEEWCFDVSIVSAHVAFSEDVVAENRARGVENAIVSASCGESFPMCCFSS